MSQYFPTRNFKWIINEIDVMNVSDKVKNDTY